MELDFVNRTEELSQLDEHARAGGLLVVFGRRRVGKTRLLTQWLRRHEGLYSQDACTTFLGRKFRVTLDLPDRCSRILNIIIVIAERYDDVALSHSFEVSLSYMC